MPLYTLRSFIFTESPRRLSFGCELNDPRLSIRDRANLGGNFTVPRVKPIMQLGSRLPCILVPCTLLMLLIPKVLDCLRNLFKSRSKLIANDVVKEFFGLFV